MDRRREPRRLVKGAVRAASGALLLLLLLLVASSSVADADIGIFWFAPDHASVGQRVSLTVSSEVDCPIAAAWIAPSAVTVAGRDDSSLTPLTGKTGTRLGSTIFTFRVPAVPAGSYHGFADCGDGGSLLATNNELAVSTRARPSPPATDAITSGQPVRAARWSDVLILVFTVTALAAVTAPRREGRRGRRTR